MSRHRGSGVYNHKGSRHSHKADYIDLRLREYICIGIGIVDV